MTPLPQLVSRSELRRELGISNRQADHVFRELPVVRFPGGRSVFVKREDVLTLIRNYTLESS